MQSINEFPVFVCLFVFNFCIIIEIKVSDNRTTVIVRVKK